MTDWNTMNVWGSEVLPSAELNSNFENVNFLLTQVLMPTCHGRLTLESGVPVSTSDQSAKGTLYFTPIGGIGNMIGLYDSTDSMWALYTFSEVSLSLAGYTADKNYDIWGYLSGGALALASTVWTDDTTRATALTTSSGILVKSGSTTHRYLGTIRINSSGGQCEDTEKQRFVFNMYNRVPRTFKCTDDTDSWTYNGVWRPANNVTTVGTSRVELVIGVAEIPGIWETYQPGNASAASIYAAAGIGLDSTTVNSCVTFGGKIHYIGRVPIQAHLRTIVPVGYHYLQRLETADSATFTWYGDDGGTYMQCGMTGSQVM